MLFLNWRKLSYEILEDPNQAIEWLMQLISVVPTDPHVLSKLGKLYDKEGDKSQAYHYYYEVFAFCYFLLIEENSAVVLCVKLTTDSFKLFKMSSKRRKNGLCQVGVAGSWQNVIVVVRSQGSA